MAQDRHSYVRFFPSDWIGGTARLPRLHRSVYFDVCCYIWDAAKPVPERELRLMIADLPTGAEIVEDLVAMGKLDRLEDGSFTNAKAMAEAEKAFGAWKAMSEGGKARQKGAAKEAAKEAGSEDERDAPRGLKKNQNQNQNQILPNGSSSRKGSRQADRHSLPDDFTPSLTGKAQENWDALEDPERELQQFKDHHIAKGSTMKDWQAAFRTWLSNAVKYQEGRNNGRSGKRSAWLNA